jgi:arabinofuranosyltransferase
LNTSSLDRRDLAAAGLAVPYAALVLRFRFVCDDAFISFRYAKNLAAGNGLVYNLGERVEGYSNFLWVLICAVIERLHGDVTVWPLLVSAAAGAALLGLVYVALRRELELDPAPSLLATLLLAASPAYAVWATSGLETMPFALLLFTAFHLLVLRREGIHPAAGVVALLLTLIRTEGIAWAVLILALAAYARSRADRPWRGQLAIAAGTVLGGYAVYFAGRYGYYHELVANTVSAKAGLSPAVVARGLKYLIWNYLTLLTPALAIPGLWLARRRASLAVLGPVAVMAAAVAGYSIAVGGDFMAMGRLLVPGLAFNTLLIGWLFQDLAARRRNPTLGLGAAALVIGLLPAFNVRLVPTALMDRFYFRYGIKHHQTELDYWRFMKRNTADWTREGQAVAAYAPANATYVRIPIGAAGYYSGLYIHDLCGLINPTVARLPVTHLSNPGHDKCQAPIYLLPQQPDILYSFISPAAELKQHLDDIRAKDYSDRYVADFIPLPPQPPASTPDYLILCRRLRPNETADKAWGQLYERLAKD